MKQLLIIDDNKQLYEFYTLRVLRGWLAALDVPPCTFVHSSSLRDGRLAMSERKGNEPAFDAVVTDFDLGKMYLKGGDAAAFSLIKNGADAVKNYREWEAAQKLSALPIFGLANNQLARFRLSATIGAHNVYDKHRLDHLAQALRKILK